MKIRDLKQIGMTHELPSNVIDVMVKFLKVCHVGDLKKFKRYKREHLEIYQNWIEKKYDSKMNPPINLFTSLCHSPSLTPRHYQIALILMEDGIDINFSSSLKSTPLSALIEHSHQESAKQLAKTLLERKDIDVNKANFVVNKSSPLHVACLVGSLEFVKLLVQKGAEVETKNEAQATPFFIACLFGREDIVRYFLQMKNVKINTKNKDIMGLEIRQALQLPQNKNRYSPSIFNLLDDYEAGRPILDVGVTPVETAKFNILSAMKQRIQHLTGQKRLELTNQSEKKNETAQLPATIVKNKNKSSPKNAEINTDNQSPEQLKTKAKNDFSDLIKKLNGLNFNLPSDVKEELLIIDSLPENNKIKIRWKLEGDKRNKLLHPRREEQITELANLNEIELKSTNDQPPAVPEIERARILLSHLTDQRNLLTKLRSDLTADVKTAGAFLFKKQNENSLEQRIKQIKEVKAVERKAALQAKGNKKWRRKEAKAESSLAQKFADSTVVPMVVERQLPKTVDIEKSEPEGLEEKNELTTLLAASRAAGGNVHAKSILEENLPKISAMPEIIFFGTLRWGVSRLFSDPARGPSILDPVYLPSFDRS